jgi:formylglycine-generating enzyme required for sulfatase activity
MEALGRAGAGFWTDPYGEPEWITIPAGEFWMGGERYDNERPVHRVHLESYMIARVPVTNAQYLLFVQAEGYKAPRHWQDNRPPKGLESHPVVQVMCDDAMAYCKWAGKRLPTEAEWEYAARGGRTDKYPWGNEDIEQGKPKANTWQGTFPSTNTNWDQFPSSSPVKTFPANRYGLYDMAGNVWEWCFDWFRDDYYAKVSGQISIDPKGPADSYDPQEPTVQKRVVRGGSFLCNASYCKGYRVTSRMKTATDTGLEHTGFRCVD